MPKLLQSTFNEWCLDSVLRRSGSLTNIQLVFRHCHLAFVIARTIFGDYICPCRGFIVALSWVVPLWVEKQTFPVTIAKGSALLDLISRSLLSLSCPMFLSTVMGWQQNSEQYGGRRCTNRGMTEVPVLFPVLSSFV